MKMCNVNRIWVACLTTLLTGFVFDSPSPAALQKIAVFKSRDVLPYNEAASGFRKSLEEKGITPELTVYDMHGSEEEGARICEEIKSRNPALVLTLGSEATRAAQVKINTVPIIFTVVLDPLASGFVENMQKPGSNLTGVAMEIPPCTQFRTLKEIMPGARRIGFIFDEDKLTKVAQMAKEAAEKLNLELVTFPIHSQQELPRVLRNIPGRVDVLWTVVDSTVYTKNSLKYILLFALRNKMPVIGYSRSMVKAGALFTLVCDYEDLGKQAGEMAFRVLKGEKPEEIPVEPPRKELLIINQIVADRIGFDIPDEAIKKAYEIFKPE
jgi:putative ABC transport system substrate-binding protein